jgi:hypothetical protein
MTAVVAADLDRTLIWSVRAAGEVSAAHCVEEFERKPLSFVAASSVRALTTLVRSGRLVPATTRTEAQYRRVNMPGGPPRFAVCLNGGRVLVDGLEDVAYSAQLRPALRRSATPEQVAPLLADWTQGVRGAFGPCRVRLAEGLFHYAVFDAAVPVGEETSRLATRAGELDWQVSVQGRKVYLVPRPLSKEAALAYLEAAHGLEVVGVAGDSLLDAGMLANFRCGWIPRDSELHRAGGQPAGTAVTRGTGLAASAEIITALSSLIADATS